MAESKNKKIKESAQQGSRWDDGNCPIHGNLKVRGRKFIGTVVSTRMRKTAVIEFERLHFIEKYERYEKRMTKLKAHAPGCIGAKDGDIVMVVECRPLSKTKNFVIMEKVGSERGFSDKMAAREASKADKKKKEAPDAEEANQRKE